MRLLAESEARIQQLQQRVADLEAATSKARAALREFEDTRLLIAHHRDTLIRQLAQETDVPPWSDGNNFDFVM
jgi:hypothetical protein